MVTATDSEYIAENAPQGSEPPAKRPDVMETYCEVMQIGACRLSESGQEVVVMNKLVKAHQIEIIPEWLSTMTGITAERREAEGVHFKEALEELVHLIGSERAYTFSGDSCVLAGNCAAHDIAFPFDRPFLRVKPRLEAWGVTKASYESAGCTEVNSGDLHKVLGLELSEISGVGTHDALHDARSLAHSVHHLITDLGVV